MTSGSVGRRNAVLVLVAATVWAGCSSSGGTTGPGPTPAIALSLNPTSASVAQGGSAQVTATLTRSGGFTGTVDLTVSGGPTGVTGTVSNPQTAGGTTTATVTIAVGSTTAPGAYTLTLTGTGSGVSNATATFSLTVTASGGFGIAASAVSVVQGANANSTVTITRTGTFAGSVALAATTVPTGLSAAFAPASTTGTTSTLTITATAGITPGNYTVGITGTAAGLPNQTASVAVTVTAAPSGGNAQIRVGCFNPIWVAFQDGNGPWTKATLTATANVYRISATAAAVGVAWVVQNGSYTQTLVNYFPQAFLTSAAIVDFCGGSSNPGPNSVSGTAAGLTGTDRANISLGGGVGLASVFNLNFGINQVATGAQDLIGWRHDPVAEGSAGPSTDRGFLHRDQNTPNNGSVGIVDFLGAESFTPATATITLTNAVAAEKLTHAIQYYTHPACVNAALYQTSAAGTPTFTARGIPAALQRADDYHQLFVGAITGTGTPVIGHTSGRSVFEIFHTVADRTVTLPPSIASTVVTTLTAPYKRLQAVAPWSASSFNSAVSIAYSSQTPLRVASVNIAPGLLSGTSVTIAMPDFTGVTGFDPTWLPATTATGTWSVQMAGSTQTGINACQEGLRSWSASALGTF